MLFLIKWHYCSRSPFIIIRHRQHDAMMSQCRDMFENLKKIRKRSMKQILLREKYTFHNYNLRRDLFA